MNLSRIIFALAIFAAFSWTKAYAKNDDECDAQFTNLQNATVTAQGGGYDPFASADAIQAFSFGVTLKSGTQCPLFVTFTSESGTERTMRSGNNHITYQLLQSASGSELNNGNNPKVNGSLSFLARLPLTPLEYYVRIPAGQVVPGGNYTSNVTMTLYQDGNKLKVLDEKSITIQANVRQITQVTLGNTESGSTTSAVLNFYNVKTGDSRGISVFVLSATDYKLDLRSENGEELEHVTDGDNWRIDYSTYFNGKRLKLDKGRDVHAVSNGKAARGNLADSYEMSFTIGDVTEKRAGTYEDVIYITLQPKP